MKFITLLLLTLTVLFAKSQNIYFGTGKTISGIEFKNTDGEILKGLKGSNENHFILGYRMPFAESKFHVSADVSYQRYISEGSNPELGSYFKWDGNFVGANLNFDY